MEITTWRKLINEVMERHKDSWENIEHCTLTEKELDIEFDNGYGGEGGKPFTLWTKERIYFPTEYDTSENVASVQRNPGNNPEITNHI
jgi:hypothetical protein